MDHIKKVSWLFLLVVPLFLFLCSDDKVGSSVEDFRVHLELIIKGTNEKGANNMRLNIELCNVSNRRIYLSNFYTLGTNYQILRFDSAQGGYKNFNSVFNSFAMQESLRNVGPVDFLPIELAKDIFADNMAKQLSEEAKAEGNSDASLVGDLYEEFYETLRIVKYVNERECLRDSVNLNPLNALKGRYKIYFNYSAHKIPLKESEGTHMFRFYQDKMPNNLKGYDRWEGEITSDTLYVTIK
jgi:hypothetical protein